MTATRNNTDKTSIKRTKIARKQKWEKKLPYDKKVKPLTRKLRKGNLLREPSGSSIKQRHNN